MTTPPEEAIFGAIDHTQPVCLEFTVRGNLDLFSYERLKAMVDAWRKGGDHADILFDLGKTAYMGSAGWAVIFQAAQEARRRGGICLVHSMAEMVHRSLSSLGADKVLCVIAADRAESLAIVRQEQAKRGPEKPKTL